MFRVLAFTVKPKESADTRYRILQYVGIAERDGICIEHRSMMTSKYFEWQIKNVQLVLRLLLYPFILFRRLHQVLFLAPQYDAVWISREMAPFGPPILERLLLRRCKRVIFDVDDALHIVDAASSRAIPRRLRDHDKFARLAPSYTRVVCGNSYLASFYIRHMAKVEIVPTVVDLDRYLNVERSAAETTRIGWIGTPLNKHHLETLREPLIALAQERRFELVIAGLNERLAWNLPGTRYIEWQLDRELEFFAHCDIGIMPLIDSPFARGKCAFKLIQCMAAALPVVASPVGANCEVIEPGRNGYLAGSADEWCTALISLMDDPLLRATMGESGRELVRHSYSVSAVWPRYAQILRCGAVEEVVCASL